MTAKEYFARVEDYRRYESGLANYLDFKGEAGRRGGAPVEPVMMDTSQEMGMQRGRQRKGVPDLSYGNLLLTRASELPQPAGNEHFLRMFGQSERNFVVGATSLGGSVPQIMEMMNGFATAIITKPEGI